MRTISTKRVGSALLMMALIFAVGFVVYEVIDSVWTAVINQSNKEIKKEIEKDQKIAELEKQLQEMKKDFAPKLVDVCPYCGKDAHEIPCQEELEFYENSKKYFTVFSAFAKGIENGKYKNQFDSLLFQVFDPEGYKKAVEEQKAKEQKVEKQDEQNNKE